MGQPKGKSRRSNLISPGGGGKFDPTVTLGKGPCPTPSAYTLPEGVLWEIVEKKDGEELVSKIIKEGRGGKREIGSVSEQSKKEEMAR